MEAVKNNLQNLDDGKEQADNIDFKMVTFSLAGKEYGIDIMKVAEISKAEKFTFVPNTLPFVRGVYNLRGEIISIIDLRVLFHLPAETKKDGALENMIILRLEDTVIGVIVDSIDKVIGISSTTIQPPHPLFGDINVKYIKGVVENNKKLYIILDTLTIFDQEEDKAPSMLDMDTESKPSVASTQPESRDGDYELSFVSDTLKTFRNFSVTDMNRDWVTERFGRWKTEREAGGLNTQLSDAAEADEYLKGFYSPYTADFWGEAYAEKMKGTLPPSFEETILAWNPGCGKGLESYSMAALFMKYYPGCALKLWAHDNDLLNISAAPNFTFPDNIVPEWIQPYITEGKNGFHFDESVRESVMFEYHDVLHSNPLPAVDVIIARDLLSFMDPGDQSRMLREFHEKLKPNGILILGQNEKTIGFDWEEISNGDLTVFRKI